MTALNQVIIPPKVIKTGRFNPKGNHAMSYLANFALNNILQYDFTTLVQQKFITSVQGIFIDNSQNTAPVIVTTLSTGQQLYMPPGYQGYFSLLSTEELIFTLQCAAAVNVPVFFVDYPVPSFMWPVTASSFPVANGQVLVSDALLESCVNGNALNVIANNGANGANLDAVAVPLATGVIVPALTFKEQFTILNTSTGGQIVYLSFGAATVNSFPLAQGAGQNFNFGNNNALNAIASAAGATVAIIGG